MDRKTFNEKLKKAGLTKKDFSFKVGVSYGSVNNWGSSKDIPYWVESWIENYIRAKDLDAVVDVVKPYVKEQSC